MARKEKMIKELEINLIMSELGEINGVSLPRNKTEFRIFKRFLQEAGSNEPLKIFVGSCPDYSHRNGLYTHEYLGSGVPLLTRYHLDADVKVLRALDRFDIPYVYTLMVADVEASDDYFQKRFTGGDEVEFLSRCDQSTCATKAEMNVLGCEMGLRGTLVSSSFYRQFGRERFLSCQEVYQAVLHARQAEDSSFSYRISSDTSARMKLYEKMYPELFRCAYLSRDAVEFLEARTIRTMAQYLALGRLICEQAAYPVIINHPTKNLGVFNDRNKFVFAGDGPQPHPTIPILEMKKVVY